MPIKKVFISYKRKEFYFAEHLATLLKSKHGIDAWFDIHELQAGTDWSESINRAKAEADALVLVASKAAIASAFVQSEWMGLRSAGKPIVVAFFEPVDLPAELASVPFVDMRGNFERGVAKIVAALNEPYKPVDDAPKSGLANMRFPLIFWLVIAAYLSPILLIPSTVLLGPDSTDKNPIIIGAVLATGFGVMLLREFLNRAYRLTSHRNFFLVISLFSIVSYLLQMAQVGQFLLTLFLVSALVAVLNVLAYWLMAYSPALMRWSPTGQALQSVRERVNKAVQTHTRPQYSDLGKTYSVSFDGADKRIANDIRQVMNAAFYHEIAPEAKADHEIVVVSNTTPVDLIGKTVSDEQAIVTVVATAFKIPPAEVVPDDNVHLSKYQWIDYRKRDKEALQNMVEDLYLSDSGQPNIHFAFKPVPENYENILPPDTINAIAQTVTLLGGLGILTIWVTFWNALTTRPVDLFGTPRVFTPMLTVVFTVSSFILLWLGRKIRAREISMLPAVLLSALALLISANNAFDLLSYASLLSSIVTCAALISIFALLSALLALHRWLLPIRLKRARAGLGVQDAGVSRMTIAGVVIMVLMIIISFVIPRVIY